MPDDPREYDIVENASRFRFDVEAFVLHQEVTGVKIEAGSVELHLGEHGAIRVFLNDGELAIAILTPISDNDGADNEGASPLKM